jgi:hypothetical protein
VVQAAAGTSVAISVAHQRAGRVDTSVTLN